MKKNPYAKKISFRSPVVGTELKRPGSSEHFVGANGDLNANSKADLFKQMAAFLEQASQYGAVTEETAAERQKLATEHRDMLMAAFNSEEAHKELGEVLSNELYLAANRDGFCRRLLARQDLSQGQRPQVWMRRKNVNATIASSATQFHTQLVRDNYLTPPEFYIGARPFVEERDIQQSIGDLLQEKYLEALEGIMVGEDRIWRNLATQASVVDNFLTTFVGTMNAGGLMSFRNQVARWNIPVSAWLIANDIWADIVGDVSFQQVIDPVSKNELLLTGQLGVIYGMTILSDAYRHPEHKVLDQGEMFIVGDPVNHGQYTDRGGVTSQPIDMSIEKTPGRGWAMNELFSMAIANTRSVARGRRIA